MILKISMLDYKPHVIFNVILDLQDMLEDQEALLLEDLDLELEDPVLVLEVVKEEVSLHLLLHSHLLGEVNQDIHHLINPLLIKEDAKVANVDFNSG
jgi:hypothetical protein